MSAPNTHTNTSYIQLYTHFHMCLPQFTYTHLYSPRLIFLYPVKITSLCFLLNCCSIVWCHKSKCKSSFLLCVYYGSLNSNNPLNYISFLSLSQKNKQKKTVCLCAQEMIYLLPWTKFEQFWILDFKNPSSQQHTFLFLSVLWTQCTLDLFSYFLEGGGGWGKIGGTSIRSIWDDDLYKYRYLKKISFWVQDFNRLLYMESTYKHASLSYVWKHLTLSLNWQFWSQPQSRWPPHSTSLQVTTIVFNLPLHRIATVAWSRGLSAPMILRAMLSGAAIIPHGKQGRGKNTKLFERQLIFQVCRRPQPSSQRFNWTLLWFLVGCVKMFFCFFCYNINTDSLYNPCWLYDHLTADYFTHDAVSGDHLNKNKGFYLNQTYRYRAKIYCSSWQAYHLKHMCNIFDSNFSIISEEFS